MARQFSPGPLVLEDRTLLATMLWANDASGDWDVAANWVNAADSSDQHVPTSDDDAEIDFSDITISHASDASDEVNTLISHADFDLSNGSLSIASTSTISGNFDQSGGSLAGSGDLTVIGSMAWTSGTISGSGAINADGGLSLGQNDGSAGYVEDLSGRSLNVGSSAILTGQEPSDLLLDSGATMTIEAGSSLTLERYASIVDNGGTPDGGIVINHGALVETGASDVQVPLMDDGSGSVEVQAGTLSLDAGGSLGGTFSVDSGGVLAFGGGTFDLSTTASIAGAGTVSFSGANIAITGTYNITGATVVSSGTATLSGPISAMGASLDASGGTLTVSGPIGGNAYTLSNGITLSGGTVDLSTGAVCTAAQYTQSGGLLTGSDAITVTGSMAWTAGTISGSGAINADGALSLGQNDGGNDYFEDLSGRTLNDGSSGTLTGQSPSGLLLDSGATLTIEAGASLTIQRYSGIFDNGGTPDGGTVINHGALTGSAIGTTNVQVPVDSQGSGSVEVESGTLNLEASLLLNGSGTLMVSPTATLDIGGDLLGNTQNAAAVDAPGTVEFDGGTGTGNPQELEAMSADLGATRDAFLNNFAYGTISLTSGSSVELVDQSQNTTSNRPEAVYANELIVPSGATLNLDGFNLYAGYLQISGTVVGGTVIEAGPPVFTTDSPPQATDGVPYSYQFQALGSPPLAYSATDLPAWAQLNAATGVLSGTPSADGTFEFTVTASGGIAPDAMVDVSLIVAGGTGATFDIAAETNYVVPNDSYVGGTTFDVGAGATVTISGGSFLGGCIFNLAQGATFDLTGGSTVTYGGTLTGSGAGTVQFTGGAIDPAFGGLTLDFPGAMFQWIGGGFYAALGNVTNLGTIHLGGSNPMGFYEDATFYNEGTMIQTGSGSLDLHSDNVSPTTFVNEAGALFLIESDSGITDEYGGDTAVVNFGTIRKTAGTGTSTLDIDGALTNNGTIEADSGTLSLQPRSITQVSNETLTGGTWIAMDGASLQLPDGTAIMANGGVLTLSGEGASIAGISGLASNSGSFMVADGASFVMTGGFSNSGTLTIGPGSAVRVIGDFTETSTGTLSIQLGGTPASNLFGQLAVTGATSLAGIFNLGLVNGFNPSSGETFDLITFGSATGDFVAFNGLNPFFTELLGSTNLDIEDSATESVDLAATFVAAPTTANVGQSITVSWQAADPSSEATTNSWLDSVFISPTPTITPASTLLGMVPQSMTLAGGTSYSASLTAALPATLAPRYYYVLVEVDSLYQLPDPNRANNVLAATTGQIDIGLPALTPGTPNADSFTAADQSHYYEIKVPAGGALDVSLQSSATSGDLALYISHGTLPTLYNYEESAAVANQPDQTAVVPQVLTSGTYYILAYSVSGAAATAGFTVTATETATVSISGISSYSGGNAGDVTVEVDGNNFTSTATAGLTLGSTTIDDSSIEFVNASQMFATFNLTGAAVGNYILTVQQGVQTITAPNTFQVVAAGSASLNITLSTPQYVRSGRTGIIVISYFNETQNDIVAPVLTISSSNTEVYFSTQDNSNDFVQYAQILAVAPSGPAGILRPGQSGQLSITLLDDNTDNELVPIQVSQIAPGQTIDWAAQQAALEPPGVPPATWSVVYGNLLNVIGSTTNSYNDALARAATYLSGLGETTDQVSDVGALWSFLVSQADAELPSPALTSAVDASLSTPGTLSLSIDRTFVTSIEGRSTPGMFGVGWVTSWQSSLSVSSAGNVIINGSLMGYFVLQANGTYLDTDGTSGTLTDFAGAYSYVSTSGTRYVFLADGDVNYEQDTNGNRITLGYNNDNQLVSLTYSNPSDPSEPSEQLSLTYNVQDYVAQVADGTGDVWDYSYDAAGRLLSVTAPGPTAAGLTTAYTYNTNANPETINALLSITSPVGSQQTFAYSATTGRLIGTSANTGADAITYSYPGEAEVRATDSAGDQTTIWYNGFGQALRVESPLEGMATYQYNTKCKLVAYTNAAGGTYQYTYDSNGNATQIVDPLGQTVNMTFNSLSDLTSITDADDNTTQYSYSAAGNLLSITYPDGTQQSFSYDPLGNLSATIEQNGDPVSYQYNARGLLAQETLADGSSETFSYDTHGNMLRAATYSSGDSLTGTTTMTYNGANELTSISYPGGLSLTFSYNALGERMQSADQSGYTVNYSYDSLGRLVELTDSSGNPVVQYTYNALGELVEKLSGNGTYTTYAYDAAGNLISEVNYAGGTTVNSSFTYTYNVLNEMTSMTDASGDTTTYSYDAIGELTQITLPGGETITYVCNSAGDRTEVINNSRVTSYSSNDDNEITQVGSSTYTYNANGDLTSVTDANGTTTYTYNDVNQLESISGSDGSVTDFQFSPLGFLVGETVNGTQTNLLVDPTGFGNVVGSYTSSGSLIADYTYGFGLVMQTGPSGAGYYDFDASGNTVGVTGSSGTYVNQYSYLPFGETTTITAELPNPFTFVGQAGIMSVASGSDVMRARIYDSSTGQFASNDPLGLGGGGTNVRQYADNSPQDLIDPSGLECVLDTAASLAVNTAIATLPTPVDSLASVVVSASSPEFNQGMATVGFAATHPGAGLTGSTQYNTIEDAENLIDNPSGGGVGGGGGRGGSAGSGNGGGAGGGGGGFCLPPPPPPPPPPGLPGGPSGSSGTATSNDPNALVGPSGYGTRGFIQPTKTLAYTIDFENDGSAAAQNVTIIEQLDPNLNWSTFQLGSFGFGSVNVTVPAGLTQYETTLSYENSDGSTLNVQVSLDFNVSTGLLTVTFVSLNPLTGQAPTGVFAGFLYPESVSPTNSDGFVEYTALLNAGLATGTSIQQQASVVFDTNAAIQTKTDLNTIDIGLPTSSVGPLPSEETSTSFTVTWSGQDDPGGSGIASYDIYVSNDGGPFALWLSDTTSTSATFAGQVGDAYGFFSVATDNVDHLEATPSAAQTTTQVVLPLSIDSITAVTPGTRNAAVSSVSVTLGEAAGSGGFSAGALTLSDDGGPNLITSAVSVTLLSGSTYQISGLSGLTFAEGSYTLTVDAADITDTYGIPGAGSVSIPWLMDTTPPTSTVKPLSAQTTATTFTVSVIASDPNGADDTAPSGVASIAIYVSNNSGPFTLFTTVSPSEPSATFTGQPGNTYAFYSIATDKAGNVQPTPAAAQTKTTVISTPAPTPTPTPTPAPTPTQTMVIGQQPLFSRKLKKGKPTGKAVLYGFALDFGVPLNANAASNAGNYQLDSIATKKVKKKKETILHAITNFTVTYLAASDAVEIRVGAKETFPTGGRITVLGGLTTASDGTLSGTAVFTIAKGGKSVGPA